MLTPSLKRLLEFIDQRISQSGVSPTYSEMAIGLGHNAGGIHAQILLLEERGYIRRVSYRARGIEVIRGSMRPARYRYFRFDEVAKELVPYQPVPAVESIPRAASPSQADGATKP